MPNRPPIKTGRKGRELQVKTLKTTQILRFGGITISSRRGKDGKIQRASRKEVETRQKRTQRGETTEKTNLRMEQSSKGKK